MTCVDIEAVGWPELVLMQKAAACSLRKQQIETAAIYAELKPEACD